MKKKYPETNSPEAGTRFEAVFCLVPTPQRGGRLKLALLISIEVSVMYPQQYRSESAQQKLRVKYRNQIVFPFLQASQWPNCCFQHQSINWSFFCPSGIGPELKPTWCRLLLRGTEKRREWEGYK